MNILKLLNSGQKKYLLTIVIVLLAGIFGVDLSPIPNPLLSKSVSEAKVVGVVDGDTITVEGGVKVRYIGVNTPEIYKDTTGKKTGEQCYAAESLAKNRELVEGKSVKLVKDISDKDKYGRLLRYVYANGLFVNDYLVKNGYAKLMTVKPNVKFYNQFKESQNEAKLNKFGMWSACPTLTQAKPQK